MRHARREQVEILLRTLPSGQHCTVSTDKATVELFGLLDHYQKLSSALVEQHGAQGIAYYGRAVTRKSSCTPRKFSVIRVMPEGSTPKTRTHTFRLGSKTTLFDIAELAHFIGVDWDFLVGPDGARHQRQWWEAKYQRGPHKGSTAA